MVHKLQSIYRKQNQKQITHESNKLCMLETGRKNHCVKKNKNNFINVIGDKFAMIIRWGKLTISFCKKLYSCINYLQLCNCVSNKNKYLQIKWLLFHFMVLVSFYVPWKQQETRSLMYFRKYRKRSVPWNGLKIFLTNMSRQPVETNKPFLLQHIF